MSVRTSDATQPSIVARLVPVMESTISTSSTSPISASTSEMESRRTSPCTNPTGTFHSRKSSTATNHASTATAVRVRRGVSSDLHSASRNCGAAEVRTSIFPPSSDGICVTADAARRVRNRAVYAVTVSSLDQRNRSRFITSAGAEPIRADQVVCSVMGPSRSVPCPSRSPERSRPTGEIDGGALPEQARISFLCATLRAWLAVPGVSGATQGMPGRGPAFSDASKEPIRA
mmetsp:Transcript_27682/g.89435  ORF Transcript_27682/g.89435 Transcript_27682/m.89435 type:complete len:231 (-) Transcript_27682:198-890(-)